MSRHSSRVGSYDTLSNSTLFGASAAARAVSAWVLAAGAESLDVLHDHAALAPRPRMRTWRKDDRFMGGSLAVIGSLECRIELEVCNVRGIFEVIFSRHFRDPVGLNLELMSVDVVVEPYAVFVGVDEARVCARQGVQLRVAAHD